MKNAIQTNLSAYIKIFLMIFIIIFILPLFAACDKTPQHTDVPNTAPSGPTQEEVSATMESLLSQYEVEDVTAQDVAESYTGEGEELLVAKLEDDGRLKMVFKANGNLYSKVVTLPQTAKNVLTNGWESYVLSKIADYDLYSVVFGQKEIDKLKVTIQNAIAEYQEEVESYQGLTTKRLSYGKSSYEDNGALQKKVSEKLLAYQYHEVREDESFVIIGVDESGRVIEYLVQMNELVGGDVYERFINGVEGEDYTVTQREVDPSKPYAAPAEREIVTFDELYTSVFGKDFVFKSYKEVLEELTDKIFPRDQITIVATGNVDNKYRIYFQNYDAIKRRNLTYIEFVGADNSVIDGLNYLAATANVDDIKDIFSDYKNKKFISETDYITQTKNYLMSIKTNIVDKQKNIENSKKDDWVGRNVFIGTKEQLDFDKFGEQYLKVTGKTDAQLISAYVGAMSTDFMDDDNFFETHYVCFFNIALVYMEKGTVYVYKGQVAVPYYQDSTTESLYDSFLGNESFKLRNENTEIIEDANVLADLPEKEMQADLKYYAADAMIDDERRLG